MVSATHEIQARVQHLVMEYGEYVPVELLLATSRLCYDDYRAWREGGLETLDDVLADHSCVVRKLLRDAEFWARELGLDRNLQTFMPGGTTQEQCCPHRPTRN